MKPRHVEHLYSVHVGHEEEHEKEGKTMAGAMEKGEHEQYSSMDDARWNQTFTSRLVGAFDQGTVVTALGVDCPERGTGRVAKSMVST